MLSWILLFLALGASAFFSCVEAALLSTSLAKAKTLAEKNKYIYELKKDEERTVISILIGNNFFNVLTSAIATEIAFSIFASSAVAVATFTVTLTLLTFGEIVPKTVGLTLRAKLLEKLSRSLYAWKLLTFPIVELYIIFTKSIKRLFGLKKSVHVSEEEIEEYILMAEEGGELTGYERKVALNALDLSSIKLEQIMTPKEKIFAVDEENKVAWLIEELKKTNNYYHRVPIYEKSINNISGYIKVRDLVKHQHAKKLKEIKRTIINAEPEISIEFLMGVMRKTGTPIAVVKSKDRLLGLVTLNDIIEEVMGEIKDEPHLRT